MLDVHWPSDNVQRMHRRDVLLDNGKRDDFSAMKLR